jgi:integrase
MSTLRLKYVQAWIDRDGRVHRYFRRAGYQRIRLPGLPGSAEFMRAYEAALEAPQAPIGAAKRSRPGSLSAAIAGYYVSLEFRSQAVSTQKMRRCILERFRAEHGDKPLSLLPAKFIAHVLSRMKPRTARNWLQAIRHLMQFAVAQEMIAADVTQGFKLPRIKSDGRHTWTEDEISAYEAAHAIGTKARLAFALALYSGQRVGDLVRMGRQHIRDGVIAVRQQKTGAELAIPVHPHLRAVLDAMPSGNLTFLVTKSGKPFTGKDLSEQFRVWCDAAKLPHCSAHGLRYAACRRLAEAGCSANEIAAISGHTTLREVERYTRAADQARLARAAMKRTRTARK